MGPRIDSKTSQVAHSPEPDTTAVDKSKVESQSTPPAEPQKPQADPKAEAKANEGLKHHAAESKGHNDMRSQLLKDQLAAQFAKGGEGGPVLLRDTGTPQAAPADNRTINDRVKVAGDGTGKIPATTIKEFAYDKVVDKVGESIKQLKPDLKREVHPKISPEQAALHDVAAGMKKYQEYMAYAQNAVAILKLQPNNSAVKEALQKHLGELDKLGKSLETAASTLGKVGKYADLAKDAIGTAQAVNKLIQNIPSNFSDRHAVGRFANSLKETSDSAQAWFERGKDALIAAGKSGAGVAFSYITGIVSIGVDGLKAGVENVNKYIDKMERNMKAIERGGTKDKEMKPPDPPGPVKTYNELRLEEHNAKVGKVYQAIDNQFAEARDGVKKAFQARHKEVGDKFDKDVMPKLYLQNRNEFIKQLRNDVQRFSTDQQVGPAALAQQARAKELLAAMEKRSGANLTPDQIQSEISALQNYYGTIDSRGNTIPLPVDKLLKQYQPEKDKFYEKHGLGEGALAQEYIRHGLTNDAKDKLKSQTIRQLGMHQGPF